MRCCSFFLLLSISWSFFFMGTYQLSSQAQGLLQLRKLLEYPNQLEYWNQPGLDFCQSSSSTQQVNITCQENLVTGLEIVGDKSNKGIVFNGFPIPNQTLSEMFSMDSFVATLARLNNLRVLTLVSLGIWGPLPDKIQRLYSLEILNLSSNFLFGSIPPKLYTMVKLQMIILDTNYFNHTIPDSFDSLSDLTVISLAKNQLKGPFPSSLSRIQSLQTLDLSENELDSGLPKMPRSLVVVMLANNSFSGIIPAGLFSLPNISYLNLASNKFSGSLPAHLSCSSNLDFVDISDNRLIGVLPSCLSSSLDTRVVKLNGNCLSVGQNQQISSNCTQVEIKDKKKSKGRNVMVLVGIIGGTLFVIVFLGFAFLVFCRGYCRRGVSEQHSLHKPRQDNSVPVFSSEILTSARFISQSAKTGTQDLPACRLFSLEELKEATNNFVNSALIGDGSYGKLYKGRLENGTQVAIRCLPPSKKYSIRNLKLRLDLLAKLRHPHLVCLLGHCIHDNGQDDDSTNTLFFVYEYVCGGNFSSHFSDAKSGKGLDWSDRLGVLIGVAKAVHYLHTGVIPGFFNNQLKTNNILLNEHGISKLSDYGLSLISAETNHRGEKGDAKSRQMTKFDDDVYSFGFILLEAIVGRSLSSKREVVVQDELASLNNQEERGRVVDPMVMRSCLPESLTTVISIMNKCIRSESWNRPSLEDILWNLQYAAQLQTTASEQNSREWSLHQ